MTKALTKSLYLLSLVVLFPSILFAATTPGGNGGGGGTTPGGNGGGGVTSPGLTNPLRDIDTFPQFLTAILKGVVELGTIVLVMMLVYVGFKFVMARGNAEEIQSARSALLWTVIGGLILLGATAIQLVIEGTVNSLR